MERALVKMSAFCNSVGMYLTSNSLAATFSLIKWISTSMCFVREWKTRFADKSFAPVLSHRMTGIASILMLSSMKRDCSQITSAAAQDNDLYYDSAELLAITFCFLELQYIRFRPRKTQCPLVDLLSSRLLAQSASEKHSRFILKAGLKCRPRWLVPFKYLNTCLQALQCWTVGSCKVFKSFDSHGRTSKESKV